MTTALVADPCRALRERFGEGLPIMLVSEHRVDPSHALRDNIVETAS